MASSRSLGWWVFLAFVAGIAAIWWGRPSPRPRAEASSVVLFAPNLTETAYVLGHAKRIAAVTDFCIWPEALLDRPRIGGMLNPNLERIVALDPGLLVLQGENTTLRTFARREGIAVANVTMDLNLESIFRGILDLDTLLGGSSSPRGETVVDSLRRRLDRLRTAADEKYSPTVLLVLGHAAGSLEELLVVGPGSYLQDLVSWIGARPVPVDGAAYRSLSLESLVADPPDVALDLRPGATKRDKDRREFERAWRVLGVEHTQVEIVVFDGILVPGPRIDRSAMALRDALLRAARDSP